MSETAININYFTVSTGENCPHGITKVSVELVLQQNRRVMLNTADGP